MEFAGVDLSARYGKDGQCGSPSESDETGKNYYKHDITTADTWWHVDHTHKSFRLYDLYCDLGWDEK